MLNCLNEDMYHNFKENDTPLQRNVKEKKIFPK